MTAGRGFIALAAVIFGRWRPGGALAVALPVRLLERASRSGCRRSRSPGATLFQALPYVLTLIAVAGVDRPLPAARRDRRRRT